MQVRERLHRLIDQLPDAELDRVERLFIQDADGAIETAIADAPDDDEPLTPEDETALSDAYADLAAGRVVSHDQARRRLLGD